MKRTILLMFRCLSRGIYLGRSALLVLIFAAFAAQAQVTIKGKVTDETGSGMPGVNVLVKGTTGGTTTDVNGDFIVEAAGSDGVLVFSFIGYESQEQSIGGRTTIDVSMIPSIESLSEVVVVGYGTQNKRDVTGAITKVESTTLLQTASHNVLDQLKGQAAGVTVTSISSVPGGGSQIRIRGSRTMVTNSANTADGSNFGRDAAAADQADAPLIVVDGIPYSGNLNDISPNDIASMEILKDASATAIYGSRGAGGVILITTKRGTSEKMTVTYDGYYGVSKVMDELRVFNGAEYAQYKLDAVAGASGGGSPAYGLAVDEQTALDAGVSTNWQKLLYQTAPITNHNLSVNGGNEKSKYSMSAGYFLQEGIIPNQDYKRYTIRGSMDHQLSNRIRLGMTTINSLSYQNIPGGAGVPNRLMRMSPLASPYDENGEIILQPQPWHPGDATVVSPLTLESKSESILARTRRLRTFNSLYAEVDIIKGLKYRINVGLDFYQDKGDNYSGPGTFVNTALTQASSTGSQRNTEFYQYTVENLLIYEKTFAERHKLSLTGLYSFQKSGSQSSLTRAIGIPFDYMQNTDFYPATSVNVGNAGDSYFWERGLISYMARALYSFDGRYSLTATVRTDGSSVLSPGNQYYTYPAFAAAWNIMNEDFMANLTVVNNLKLRVGWGKTASQGINPYSTLGSLGTSAYNFGPGTNGQQGGYTITDLPNNALKWQNTAQLNIGLDFGVLGNRITGAIEVYNQQTQDILLPVSLPPTNGASTTIMNVGKTKAHGLELTLNTINVKTTSGFVWSTDFNYFFNREEITELTNPNEKSNRGNGWFVGHPITVIYDYKKLGIWQTGDPELGEQIAPVQQPGDIRVLDWNTSGAQPGSANYGTPDGRITPDDRKVIGNFQPDFEAGMTNRFTFKRFDFSFNIYARIGQTIVVPYLSGAGGGSNTLGYNWFLQARDNQLKVDYWTPDNPTNAFPQPDANLSAPLYSSTLAYVDGSFIKMRYINLGYDIPSAPLSKVGITSLRVYTSFVNPFVIWSPFVDKGYGPDPEGNGFGGAVRAEGAANDANAVGRAVTVNANVPATRQFIFGVNLKF